MLSRQLNGPHGECLIAQAALLLGLQADHLPLAGGRGCILGGSLGVDGGRHAGGVCDAVAEDDVEGVEEALEEALEESEGLALLRDQQGPQEGKDVHLCPERKARRRAGSKLGESVCWGVTCSGCYRRGSWICALEDVVMRLPWPAI